MQSLCTKAISALTSTAALFTTANSWKQLTQWMPKGNAVHIRNVESFRDKIPVKVWAELGVGNVSGALSQEQKTSGAGELASTWNRTELIPQNL